MNFGGREVFILPSKTRLTAKVTGALPRLHKRGCWRPTFILDIYPLHLVSINIHLHMPRHADNVFKDTSYCWVLTELIRNKGVCSIYRTLKSDNRKFLIQDTLIFTDVLHVNELVLFNVLIQNTIESNDRGTA